jgi:transposase
VPRNGGGSRGRKIDRCRLAELAKQQPDATLVELGRRLGVSVTPWAICKALRELGLSYKKSRSAPPSRAAPMSRSGGRSGG